MTMKPTSYKPISYKPISGNDLPRFGGITTYDAQLLIRGLRGLNLIGGDVVEISPPFDMSGNTALVAVTMMFAMMCETLCLLAEVSITQD